MIRRFSFPMALSGVVLLAAACVTINVYFPEAAIKDLSQKIEEEVRKKAAEQGSAPAPAAVPETPSPGGGSSLLDVLLGVSTASAAEEVAAPEISSPSIRKVIESRAARVAELNKHKAAGVLGENNQGLLEVRALDTLSDLKARAEVQRLVKAENQDREELFREIAVAKKVELSQLPKIRETYAATLRDNARPGDWIQEKDGSWKQK